MVGVGNGFDELVLVVGAVGDGQSLANMAAAFLASSCAMYWENSKASRVFDL